MLFELPFKHPMLKMLHLTDAAAHYPTSSCTFSYGDLAMSPFTQWQNACWFYTSIIHWWTTHAALYLLQWLKLVSDFIAIINIYLKIRDQSPEKGNKHILTKSSKQTTAPNWQVICLKPGRMKLSKIWIAEAIQEPGHYFIFLIEMSELKL